jgi:hypothetical protein
MRRLLASQRRVAGLQLPKRKKAKCSTTKTCSSVGWGRDGQLIAVKEYREHKGEAEKKRADIAAAEYQALRGGEGSASAAENAWVGCDSSSRVARHASGEETRALMGKCEICAAFRMLPASGA